MGMLKSRMKQVFLSLNKNRLGVFAEKADFEHQGLNKSWGILMNKLNKL